MLAGCMAARSSTCYPGVMNESVYLETTVISYLAAREGALKLARSLVQKGALPRQAGEDALHIALAVTNGITYLLTWNLKHLANAWVRSRIEKVCREQGYEPTIIPHETTASGGGPQQALNPAH